MSKKAKVFLVFTIIFAFVLTACSATAPGEKKEPTQNQQQEQTKDEKGEEAKPAPSGEKKQLTIGVSINALSNIHNQHMFEYTEEEIKAAGHKAVMLNANGIAVQQMQDIENLKQQNVDVIIIQNGDRDGLKNVVKDVSSSGIKVISMESGWIPGVSCMFAPDEFQIGAAIYSMLAGEMGYQGEIIAINHNDHPAIRARRNVQEAVLKEYADIKKVANITSGFPGTVELAYKGVESALQAHPDVKAIWATFDLEALGAAQACKALGREDIMIVGVDGEVDALKMIKEGGPIIATVVTDMRQMAKEAVEVSVKLTAGEPTKKFYPVPFTVITKGNVDEFLKE